MPDEVALLLRRAGFGPTQSDLAAARKAGYSATVAQLTAPTGPDAGAAGAPVPVLGPDPYTGLANPTTAQRAVADEMRRNQTRTITRWWLDRMTVADQQALEKLVFFWHGHWATSVKKVIRPALMLTQHATLRKSFDFAVMTHNMVADPALIYWLDGQLNTQTAPNENLARELMELFMLGVGNYTETDVREVARALTGWKIDYGSASTHLAPQLHDSATKTVLGVTQPFTAQSLVDFLLRQETCPRFIAARLWFRYASSTDPIPEATQERMVAAFPASSSMLGALFRDDAFRASAGRLVKQPVEWLVGAMRQLGIRPMSFTAETFDRVVNWLESMGQVPFAPPSVGGWPAGAAWLTSAAAHARLRLASRLAELAAVDQLKLDDVTRTLCIDTWTNRTHSVLRSVREPRRLLTLALASPEYLVT
jgi:uncharacterized protein (DUF1800 family)